VAVPRTGRPPVSVVVGFGLVWFGCVWRVGGWVVLAAFGRFGDDGHHARFLRRRRERAP